MEPASSIIAKFAVEKDGVRIGGEAKVASILNTAYTAPYRWQAARNKGGTGGSIPQRYHRALLSYARENGIDLKAEDFLPLMSSLDEAAAPSPVPAEAAE